MNWVRSIAVLITVAAAAGCNDDPVGPNQPGIEPQLTEIVDNHTYTQVSAGSMHNCALLGGAEAGTVGCWGFNDSGQAPASRSPTAAGTSFTQVSAGGTSCALRNDGVIECWGNNNSGSAPPIRSTSVVGTSFVQLSTGGYHDCALRNDGVVECWGTNISGSVPGAKEALSGRFVHVSAGHVHSCALRDDGVIECWGLNSQGQAPPTRETAAGYVQVSAGEAHSCALRADAAVECWGENTRGQAPATRTATTGAYAFVSTGGVHTCALRNDGVIECWGANDDGQAPAQKTAATGQFVQLNAGARHTCALRSDQQIECWGWNDNGQAGDGLWHFAWSGFFGLDNGATALNPGRAGAVIKLEFSLGSDEGSAIFPHFAQVGPIDCTDPATAPASLSTAYYSRKGYVYTPARKDGGDYYTYYWVTNRSWRDSCHRFIMTLKDNTQHFVNFRF